MRIGGLSRVCRIILQTNSRPAGLRIIFREKNPIMTIKAIITGATGMVGEGVLHECLNHPQVEKVLLVNRRPSGVVHAKVSELIVPDFFDLTSVESQLKGYNACFFCLGMSSVGMTEEDYRRGTYELTLNFARTLLRQNDDMVFNYVSGAATDSSEKGRSMWARVKGKTENDLIKLGFKGAYMFRPGIMEPTPGLRNTLKLYRYLGWLMPVFRMFSPKYICKLADVGQAMINSVTYGYPKAVLEVPDIVTLASKSS